MESQEKVKVAITAGIVAVILLILVIFLALSGKHDEGDDEKLADNISEYASSASAELSSQGTPAASQESEVASSDEGSAASSTVDSQAVKGSATEYSEYLTSAKGDVSGNSFYKTNGPLLKDIYKNESYDVEAQLKEMKTYWEDGNTDAVRDLAHLTRFEAMSYSLKGTKDFYYIGDTNANGNPEGIGLAVYADSQYYYGQWYDGKRNGKGVWFVFYPDYSNYVVTEHMYTGDFKNDMPDGEGQEHFDYNSEYMNEEDFYVQNVIGGFVEGYYHGELYLMSIDKSGVVTEWLGTCDNGTFKRVDNLPDDKKGNVPVLKKYNNPDELFYMAGKKNSKWHVNGMIIGGNVRK